MIDGNCGSVIDDGSKLYRCFKIKGTPLSVGFIYSKRHAEISLNTASSEPPKLVYTPKELVGYLIAEKSLCPDELGAHAPLDRFEPFVFGDYPSCPKTQDKYFPFAFVKAVQTWDKSWPNLEENTTCLSSPLPFNLHPKYFVSTFVQFYQGITVLYPKW